MGCSSCGNKSPQKPSKLIMDDSVHNKGVVSNMTRAVSSQSNKFRWFKDGVTGLFKCVVDTVEYTKEQIISNRSVCEGCEYSTKKNGKNFHTSQCMAPDPEKNGEVCGCFILCKTQVGKCPLNKWTTLTINQT